MLVPSALGYRPSGYDQRDWVFSAPPSLGIQCLQVPFLRDQGPVPCCVSVAVATCMEILDFANPPSHQLSPLFSYFVSRGGSPELFDVEPRRALDMATRYGLCSAGLHTERYSPDGARQAPTMQAFDDARSHRILATPGNPSMRAFWYERLMNADRVGEWIAAISGGVPILFGFFVTPSYWNLTEVEPELKLAGDETSQAGHCAVAVGVHEDNFVIQDSRGLPFGNKGQWLLPFRYLPTPLVAEAWVIRRINYD